MPLLRFYLFIQSHCLIAELFSFLFLVVSFQDSPALEEPVKVLKVGLYISACRVACGEVDWYKANFRL